MHDLRRYRHDQHRQERGAGRAHRLHLLHGDFLGGLRHELREKSHRGDDQGKDARERAESDRFHE